MEDTALALRSLTHSPAASSCSLHASSDAQRLHVLVAANGPAETAQATALMVRLSKNPKIELRAVVDSSACTNRLLQTVSVFINEPYTSLEMEQREIEAARRQAFELCEWADMLVLAPLDANGLAKMLQGIPDCVLLEILRGWDVSKKILLVPAMSTLMWENPMTKKQLSKIRRKWQWIRVLQPVLWEVVGTKTSLLPWDGFHEVVEIVKNQAELKTLGHDIDNATTGVMNWSKSHVRTEVQLPPELWSLIFHYVGDWEVAMAVKVYANLPRPPEWQRRVVSRPNEMQKYMHALEWVILTSPMPIIIEKLASVPADLTYLSSLCVKLIFKFCLTDLLTHLETHHKDIFWNSFGQTLLPTKASAVYGRTEILEWWRTSPSFLSKDYTAEAVDGASRSGFLHVLDWWRRSGLPLKYTDAALEQASSKGRILVLEWWRQASSSQHHDVERRNSRRLSSDSIMTAAETQPPLQLKPGKALLAAAQNNQVAILRWWESSGIPTAHAESVAKIASAHGHTGVLDAWHELKGDKMVFDSQVLVGPTKNGHVDVLQWWKDYSRSEPGKLKRVEYKTCDIEEALEDSVRNRGVEMEVRRWWAHNGLNLSIVVSEWTKTKLL